MLSLLIRGVVVPVPVMQIGVVWMAVHERLVPLPVAVRLDQRVAGGMGVLMMSVVRVQVLVLHRFVRVGMLVPFTDMQPDA